MTYMLIVTVPLSLSVHSRDSRLRHAMQSYTLQGYWVVFWMWLSDCGLSTV